MNKYLYLSIMCSFILLTTACGSTEPTSNNTDIVEESQEQEAHGDSNNNFETQVGETTKNEAGEITLIARNSETETITTGPIVLNLPQTNTLSGKLKGDVADLMETQEIEYIQIDMEVENTSEDTVIFYADQATITTNTGEQLDMPNIFLSDHINGEYIGSVDKSGTQHYILDKSKAQDIEWIRILISAPQNENFEKVGEDIDIKVEF